MSGFLVLSMCLLACALPPADPGPARGGGNPHRETRVHGSHRAGGGSAGMWSVGYGQITRPDPAESGRKARRGKAKR